MAKMIINGEQVDARSGDTYEVKNPANGEVVDTAPLGGVEDAEAVIASAAAAAAAWADTAEEERASLIHQGIAKIKEARKEISALLTAEQGKPIFEAGGELNHFLHGMEFYAGLAGKIRGEQVSLPPALGKHAYGVV